MRYWRVSTIVLSLILALAACGDENGGGTDGPFSINKNASIKVDWGTDELSPGDTISVPSNVAQGDEAVAVGFVCITNIGNGPLSVYDLTLTSSPEGAFWLEASENEAMPTEAAPWVVSCSTPEEGCAEGAVLRKVQLMFKRPADAAAVTGTLTIGSNTFEEDKRTLTFPVVVSDQPPEISIQPSTVDFGLVGNGEVKKVPLKIVNTGGRI